MFVCVEGRNRNNTFKRICESIPWCRCVEFEGKRTLTVCRIVYGRNNEKWFWGKKKFVVDGILVPHSINRSTFKSDQPKWHSFSAVVVLLSISKVITASYTEFRFFGVIVLHYTSLCDSRIFPVESMLNYKLSRTFPNRSPFIKRSAVKVLYETVVVTFTKSQQPVGIVFQFNWKFT